MNRIKYMAAILSLNALLTSCASVQSVSLTPIPKQRAKVVKAEVSKFIFLGFNFNNDFIDEIMEQLKGQCPDGIVSGILTKDEAISYFLAHTRKVSATGFCTDASTKQASAEISR